MAHNTRETVNLFGGNFAECSPFSRSFVSRLSNKLLIMWTLKIPPQLKCVATLPHNCKSRYHLLVVWHWYFTRWCSNMKCGLSWNYTLQQILYKVCQWKDCENQSKIDRATPLVWCLLFGNRVYIRIKACLLFPGDSLSILGNSQTVACSDLVLRLSGLCSSWTVGNALKRRYWIPTSEVSRVYSQLRWSRSWHYVRPCAYTYIKLDKTYAVKISASTDILWQVFRILTKQVTYMFVSVSPRNNENSPQNIPGYTDIFTVYRLSIGDPVMLSRLFFLVYCANHFCMCRSIFFINFIESLLLAIECFQRRFLPRDATLARYMSLPGVSVRLSICLCGRLSLYQKSVYRQNGYT